MEGIPPQPEPETPLEIAFAIIWEGRFECPKPEDLHSLCAVPSRLGTTVRHAGFKQLNMPIMQRFFSLVAFAIFVTLGLLTLPTSASDFANNVLSYVAGSNPANGFTNPLVALGPPERFTGEGFAPGAVTPFHPCFSTNEIVSIGAGGQLTLGFDPPLRDQANNPFGIDFIVFGNSFFTDAAYPNGVVGALANFGLLASLRRQPEHRRKGAGMRADMPPDHDVLEHGHLGKEADVLEGAGNARLGHLVHGGRRVGLAVEFEAPGIRRVEPGDDIEEGGLAGAVRSDQAIDLPACDRDADIGESL